MQNYTKLVEIVDLDKADFSTFTRKCVGCIVLTKDRKILLQMRPENWHTFPGCLATFGGDIEGLEIPMQTLKRELQEELGAQVVESDTISLGAITEAVTKYTGLIYTFFWHDRIGTITGCYECLPLYFDDVASALAHPKIMDDVRWLLEKCRTLGLLD